MLKRYTFWLSAAVIFQLLTGLIHGISLFVTPATENETERQLQELITTYAKDLGAGFRPTFGSLFTAVSSCFSLLCFLGGLTNGYLLFKHAEPYLMRGIIAINVGIFGVCFLMMLVFTFLPPIILTGLIFINLIAALVTIPKIGSAI
jgi:hypothetical protein